jgi:Ca-activated chloride channel family protein
VNPALLEKMASETGGRAFVATDGKALADSMHAVLDHLERTRFEASVATYEDLFPFLLLPGVALVALDALLRALLLRRFP